MKNLTEVEVSELWQRIIKDNANFSTVDNRTVQVLYPGRPSDEPGADFKDAALRIGGRVTKGDIEVHVRSSDWCMHCHHKNKMYNGIVLHVVMWHDAKDVTRLENGNSIPLVSLESQRNMATCEIHSPVPSCRRHAYGMVDQAIEDVLERAGEARFFEKRLAFHRELESSGAGQCLYRGIMGALGYSRNINPFQMVAEKLPLSFMETTVQGKKEESAIAHLEALLLGTAGFLPSQGADTHIPEYDDIWLQTLESDWHFSGRKPCLSLQDWQLFRVRPINFPARRLAGMASLLERNQKAGLLGSLMDLVEKASINESGQQIETELLVPTEGYWADHFAPGKMCSRLDQFLIGRSRAKEIVVNVLLPFIGAYNQSEIGEKAFTLYSQTRASEENTIERHMRIQLGLRKSQVKTARQQQGLLHIYRNFCTQGRCGECPLK